MPAEVTEIGVSTADASDSRNLRWVELALVMFVAFARPIFASSYTSIYGIPSAGAEHAGSRYVLVFIHELSALLVLAYVLHRSGRSFRSLGLRASWREVRSGLALSAGCWVLSFIPAIVIELGHKLFFGDYAVPPNIAAMFPKASVVAMIPFFALNPFYEELIVRGYLMTEVEELSGSVSAAVIASVVLQTSYHLYQGWLAATLHLVSFLILSIYYARTRKLLPVLVVHAAFDWTAALFLFSGAHH